MKKYIYLICIAIIFPVSVLPQCNYSYGKWDTTLSSMPAARSSFSALVYHDTIYILGGFTNSLEAVGFAGTVDAYIPATDTWITGISEMPFPRGCPNACLIGDKIYAFGGARPPNPDLETKQYCFGHIFLYDESKINRQDYEIHR